MEKFSNSSNLNTFKRRERIEEIKKLVAHGAISPLSGTEFQQEINRSNITVPNPRKLAKLLMPNAY